MSVWRLRPNRKSRYARGETEFFYPDLPSSGTVALSAFGAKAIYTNVVDPPVVTGMMYTDAAPSWLPAAGEDIKTFMRPTSATVVNAWDYSASRDIDTVLRAVDSARGTQPTYVQLDGSRYFMNDLTNYAPQNIGGDWRGYTNGGAVLGVIGDSVGVDGAGNPKLNTEIVFSASMISNSASQVNSIGQTPRDYALDPLLDRPVGIAGFYISDNNKTAPLFFSGIHFMGQLQTPFGVYSANAQTKFKRLQTASAPLPWNGFSIWRALPGSRFQFCKFSGVGFTLNSAPPFETCALGTNYCNITTYKVEIDGRTALEFDGGRRRAGGGYMLNKSVDENVINLSLHDTRRSGFAFNTNTNSTAEKVHVLNNEFTNISNFGSEDTWPSDVAANFNPVAGFNDYNVEGFMGQYWIENAHQNSAHGHISYAGTQPPPPDRTYLFVKNARTDDTLYNGMFRISTQGNTSTSDMVNKLTADFNFWTNMWFDIRRSDGVRLAPIKASQYNAALHTPNSHYLMRSF